MNGPNPNALKPAILVFFLLLTAVFLANCGEGLVPEQVAADTIFLQR